MISHKIKAKIREIPDWPKPGVNFKDITPLLEDKKLFSLTIDRLCAPYENEKIDKIIGIDARGFLLASAMAYKLKTGVAIIRKKGKLPSKTVSKQYALEYGSNTIEMHQDSILPGEKILLVDDVLATGGTMAAAVNLVKKLKGEIIGIEFLIELSFLNGKNALKGQKINSLIKYES
ncbi:MAG: adenine phosphoribosyltransferase [Candidatus Staskawiczbacteria bacterium]|nr:adenine phosphoribosyltransferase [Candidatus Staskawiczbacteria bacterium]